MNAEYPTGPTGPSDPTGPRSPLGHDQTAAQSGAAGANEPYGVGGPFGPGAGSPAWGYEPEAPQPQQQACGATSWWTARRKVAATGLVLAISVAAGGAGALGAVALAGGRTVYASPTAV